jgi:hypothetical protein
MPESREKNSLVGVHGWLLFLCFCLVLVAPAGFIVKYLEWLPAVQWSRIEPGLRSFIYVSTLVDLVVMSLGVIAGIALWLENRSGPALAKIYLITRPVIVAFTWMLERRMLAPSTAEFRHVVGSIIASAIWFAYLEKSERVRNTFEPEFFRWKNGRVPRSRPDNSS